MAGLPRQIIGSFEDIGKDIVREVASVPKDVVGKALESLGTSSGPKKSTQGAPITEKKLDPNSPLETFGKMNTTKEKKLIARSALEYLASSKNMNGKEKSVWEKQQEEDQRKREALEKQKLAERAVLKPVSTIRKKGDLYGAHAKKTAVENKNTRQD